jgi:hypothetical protein
MSGTTSNAPRTITVVGGNLFDIATRYLGDGTQAVRIALKNGLKDWYLSGVTTLTLPPVDPTQTGGVPPQ